MMFMATMELLIYIAIAILVFGVAILGPTIWKTALGAATIAYCASLNATEEQNDPTILDN